MKMNVNVASKVKKSEGRARNRAADGLAADGLVASGVVEIPLSKNGHKPAWIVDGQQRALAISKSNRRDLPIPVNAFVADEVELQRDQFLRVNNKGLYLGD